MKKSVVYGPVPSRRLGRSLGVDLVPYKICSYNCVYCQLGPTPSPTVERKPYIPADKVVADVTEKLDKGVYADYITLGGSGEPTLNSDTGEIIRRLRKACDIPVAVLTNGSLFMIEDVRRELMEACAVLPSFDASDPGMFRAVNRPCPELSFEEMAEGQVRFRREYEGSIWVEIFLIRGMNDSGQALENFRKWMDRIRPDRIHINTAVRPTADSDVSRPDDERLEHACRILGSSAEIVAPYQGPEVEGGGTDINADIVSLLSRRPCTLADISSGLNTHQHEILKYLQPLVDSGEVETTRKNGLTYYKKGY